MKPLLGLVMIVKNEASGIVETLASVAAFIDHWTILDTGSTDGTQALIQTKLAGIPGTLHEEPFVDFATTRNRVLELHGKATEFTLMLSGDDILIGAEQLRAALTAQCDAPSEVYNVERQLGHDRFPTAIVLRTGTGWWYVGRTHEVLTKPGHFATQCIPGAYVTRNRDGDQAAKRSRWEQDLGILVEDHAREPTNPRTTFYLAQTYECLGRYREALAMYERRIALEGWVEETYEAHYRCARVLDALKTPWPFVEERYLRAHAVDPRRAEPLYAVAKHWYVTRNYALTYLFAQRAEQLPYPEGALFVHAAVYTHEAAQLVAIAAYYLGRQLNDSAVLAVGRRAAEKVVRVRSDDEQARRNLQFYVELD